MNYKNLFFIICISLISVSELCSMQLATKRILRPIYCVGSTYPMMQKRECLSEAFAFAGGCLMFAGAGCMTYGIGASVIGYCQDRFKRIEVETKEKKAYTFALGFDQHPQVYINLEELKKVDEDQYWRPKYISDLRERYNQLSYVESKEIDKFNGDVQYKHYKGSDLSEKYCNTFTIVAHKKECIYNMTCLLEKDMPRYKKQLEQTRMDNLNLVKLTDALQDDVNKKIKQCDAMIKDIQKKHLSSAKRPPQQAHVKKVPQFKEVKDTVKKDEKDSGGGGISTLSLIALLSWIWHGDELTHHDNHLSEQEVQHNWAQHNAHEASSHYHNNSSHSNYSGGSHHSSHGGSDGDADGGDGGDGD